MIAIEFIEAHPLEDIGSVESSPAKPAVVPMARSMEKQAALPTSHPRPYPSELNAATITGPSDAPSSSSSTAAARALHQTMPYAGLEGKENVEPSDTSSDLTRIQFRLTDGSRAVRKFNKNDLVKSLFQYILFLVPESRSMPFDVSRVSCGHIEHENALIHPHVRICM